MNINKLFIAFLLSCITLPTMAQQVSIGPRGESVSVLRLGSVTSYENEEKQIFLSRVGRMLHNYTAANGFEACACVCEGEDGYGVVVSTNESHIGCATIDACPDNMTKTSKTIHSHPDLRQNIRLNSNDRAFMSLRGSRVQRNQIARTRSGFSEIDKSLGPGYLVEDGMLMYFDGKNESILMPVADKVFPHVN